MENKSLYQINQEYLELASQLVDGELTDEIFEALKINSQELQIKGVNYAFLIKQLDGECGIIDAEIDRLTDLKKSRSNVINRLKDTLSGAMQLFQIEKIETPLIKISFRSSESIEITGDLDPVYMRTKITESPDKTAIKEAIKAGLKVEGAKIIVNKNIQIK